MKIPVPSSLPFHRVAAAACLTAFLSAIPAEAKVKLPAVIGPNMVLQRDMTLPIWGWDKPGQSVTVKIDGQSHTSTAGKDGLWEVKLKPLSSRSGKPLTMTVTGSSERVLKNILVGEVWICSGQSNMQWPVSNANDPDLESATANFPRIRLISLPQVGTQEPQDDFDGKWERCTPETVKDFSAVGYFFGRQLHQTLKVPIGLIDNAWGGSAAEAWVPRQLLEKDPFFKPLMDEWRDTEATYDKAKVKEEYEAKLRLWETRIEAAKAAGKPAPPRPRPPRNPLIGQHRPGNLWNGMIHPIMCYGIRGAIWYQGESNSGRAYEYRKLFPLMISHWRKDWGQGDFPFYWVQLADFREEVDAPADSAWAELREAQTLTMKKLPNTGEAVILNLGEASDIHPKNKQDVAKRLARWALAEQYGQDGLVYRSPIYKGMQKKGEKIEITFDHVGGGLDTFDVRTPIGFAIAGADKKFVWADAKIVGKDKVEVWSDAVAKPAAARYAWADNPVCNLQNKEGLPATPFRTDNWPMITKPAPPAPAATKPKPPATKPAPAKPAAPKAKPKGQPKPVK